ncbi:hypothetical protein JZ751_028825 [Albula glossodonta]|uniref:Uncharacterized protein n=1 Tax=Albula glossodonta TaxID=121402 RepID=A0A8T2NBQ6_9TELE|nr:hypothetical protein JZ751_028825 [Albula glossodonta]
MLSRLCREELALCVTSCSILFLIATSRPCKTQVAGRAGGCHVKGYPMVLCSNGQLVGTHFVGGVSIGDNPVCTNHDRYAQNENEESETELTPQEQGSLFVKSCTKKLVGCLVHALILRELHELPGGSAHVDGSRPCGGQVTERVPDEGDQVIAPSPSLQLHSQAQAPHNGDGGCAPHLWRGRHLALTLHSKTLAEPAL